MDVVRKSYMIANDNINKRGVIVSSFMALCFVFVAYCINNNLSTRISMIIYSISLILQIALLILYLSA